MKTLKIVAAAIVVLSFAACSSNATKGTASGADSLKTAVPTPPSKAEIDTVSYLMGVQLGATVKGYNLGDLNFAEIKKGASDFIKAKGSYRDTSFSKQFKVDPERMGDIMNSYIMKRRAYVSAENAQKEVKWLAENAKKEGVQISESGLQYLVKELGSAEKIGEKDTLFVHYKGTLTDGTVFDETPATAPSARMLLNRVIPGWTEGLQLIGEGGTIQLFVPSKLGYGEQGQPQAGIEGNTPLIFEVTVDSVKRYVAPAPDKE